MSSSVLGTLLGYMLVNSFTPGPGNILALNTISNLGWKKGKKLIWGICCGYACVQCLCTFAIYGLNTFLTPALSILKYIGGAYMIWLAIHIIRSKPESNGTGEASFRTGFMLQLVNIKIYFYITTLLTVYLVPYFRQLPKLLFAGVGVIVIGSIASLTWAFLGIKMKIAYEKYYKSINFALGLFLLYCTFNIVRS